MRQARYILRGLAPLLLLLTIGFGPSLAQWCTQQVAEMPCCKTRCAMQYTPQPAGEQMQLATHAATPCCAVAPTTPTSPVAAVNVLASTAEVPNARVPIQSLLVFRAPPALQAPRDAVPLPPLRPHLTFSVLLI